MHGISEYELFVKNDCSIFHGGCKVGFELKFRAESPSYQ